MIFGRKKQTKQVYQSLEQIRKSYPKVDKEIVTIGEPGFGKSRKYIIPAMINELKGEILMEEKLKVCEEYIWQVCCMIDMSDGGSPALYGLEQHRIELHEKLCDLFGIDHIKSKEVLSYLDDKIGIDISKLPNADYLEVYTQSLCNYLHEHLEELK